MPKILQEERAYLITSQTSVFPSLLEFASEQKTLKHTQGKGKHDECDPAHTDQDY